MIKKVVDYDKHEAHYFDISNDLTIKLDKDVLIDKLLEENEQLQNNWNELKKWLEEDLKDGRSEENVWLMGCYDQVKEVLNKMQELEGNNG